MQPSQLPRKFALQAAIAILVSAVLMILAGILLIQHPKLILTVLLYTTGGMLTAGGVAILVSLIRAVILAKAEDR